MAILEEATGRGGESNSYTADVGKPATRHPSIQDYRKRNKWTGRKSEGIDTRRRKRGGSLPNRRIQKKEEMGDTTKNIWQRMQEEDAEWMRNESAPERTGRNNIGENGRNNTMRKNRPKKRTATRRTAQKEKKRARTEDTGGGEETRGTENRRPPTSR